MRSLVLLALICVCHGLPAPTEKEIVVKGQKVLVDADGFLLDSPKPVEAGSPEPAKVETTNPTSDDTNLEQEAPSVAVNDVQVSEVPEKDPSTVAATPKVKGKSSINLMQRSNTCAEACDACGVEARCWCLDCGDGTAKKCFSKSEKSSPEMQGSTSCVGLAGTISSVPQSQESKFTEDTENVVGTESVEGIKSSSADQNGVEFVKEGNDNQDAQTPIIEHDSVPRL